MSTFRTRSMGGFSAQSHGIDLTRDGGETSRIEAKLISSGNQTVMSDWVTAGFKRMSAEGSIINNPMERLTEAVGATGSAVGDYTGDFSPGSIRRFVYSNCPTLWASTLPDPHSYCLNFPSISTLETTAITSAVAKMNDFDVLGLVTVIEANKTLRLYPELASKLVDTIEEFVRIRKTMRAGKLKQATRAWGRQVDNLSSLWLAFRYGVTPTLLEFQGLVTALHRVSKPTRKTFRGNSEHTDGASWNRTSESLVYHFSLNCEDTYELKQKIRAQFLCEFQALVNDEEDLPEQLGFSWRAVPISLWEATYMSFMLDWVVGIGDYIAALTPNPRWKVLGGTVSSVQASDYMRSVTSVNEEHFRWNVTASGAQWARVEKKLRRVASKTEISPTFRVNMNWQRWIDAAALATTNLKRTRSFARL